MALIVLISPQAVGKMTVGKKLAEKINGKLLYNHQTIDLYANFLGFNEHSFNLSDQTRKSLFRAFIANKGENVTSSIIFTVLIHFDLADDLAFLEEISTIFLDAQEEVYFIELKADLETRLARNTHEDRLNAKPSKRDLEFSRQDLLHTAENHQSESNPEQLTKHFPKVNTLKIDNSHLSAEQVADKIIEVFKMV